MRRMLPNEEDSCAAWLTAIPECCSLFCPSNIRLAGELLVATNATGGRPLGHRWLVPGHVVWRAATRGAERTAVRGLRDRRR